MTVEIVLITDDYYLKFTAITITSIIKNKSEHTLLNINILSNNLSTENIDFLKTFEIDNVNINIIDSSDYISEFKDIVQGRHVTYTALLKFYIPIIFNNLDKILYFDSDLIIQSDLSEFYNHDLENYYAECVLDVQNYNKAHLKNIKFMNEKYFNSGVLLLNLKKMREDNISQKLISHKLNNPTYSFMDQDTLNCVLGSNVKFISYKYNFLPELFERFSLLELNEYFEEQIPNNETELFKSCVILHLGGKKKPWIYDMGYLTSLYKKYWELSNILENFPSLQPFPKEDNTVKYSLLEKIFSIKVDKNYMYKIISILGIRMRFKRKLK